MSIKYSQLLNVHVMFSVLINFSNEFINHLKLFFKYQLEANIYLFETSEFKHNVYFALWGRRHICFRI